MALWAQVRPHPICTIRRGDQSEPRLRLAQRRAGRIGATYLPGTSPSELCGDAYSPAVDPSSWLASGVDVALPGDVRQAQQELLHGWAVTPIDSNGDSCDRQPCLAGVFAVLALLAAHGR